MNTAVTRTVLLVCRAAPYGCSRGRDALDVAMAFGAFEQPVTLLLLADAVLMLKAGQQDGAGTGQNIERLMGVLPDYGIERVCVDGQALRERGVAEDALFGNPETLDESSIRALLAAHDVVISL